MRKLEYSFGQYINYPQKESVKLLNNTRYLFRGREMKRKLCKFYYHLQKFSSNSFTSRRPTPQFKFINNFQKFFSRVLHMELLQNMNTTLICNTLTSADEPLTCLFQTWGSSTERHSTRHIEKPFKYLERLFKTVFEKAIII